MRLPDLRSVAPRHGAGSVASVLPAAVAAVRGGPPGELPLPAGVRGVVVLIVDGLGRQLLDAHADLAPSLASAPGATLDAPFPTTTATSLTSIGRVGHPASTASSATRWRSRATTAGSSC
jgi:hypothetical protein